MIRFYVIRHGETEPNTRYACVGRADVSLNDKGVSQSYILADKLNIKADAIYVSPLSRAIDTIKPYLEKYPDVTPIISKDLIERDFGAWEDLSFAQIEEKYPDKFREWMDNYISYTLPEGESLAVVQRRVEKFLGEVIPENDNKTVFITTHLCVARHLISTLLGMEAEMSRRFTMKNAGYAIIDYDIDAGYGVLKYLNV